MSPELHDVRDGTRIAGRHVLERDQSARRQIAMAAALLRSIRPADGEVEIALHEIARRLEHIADTGQPCPQPLAFPDKQPNGFAS